MANVSEICVVHHSHTDIGYTHEQPVVWDLQRRFIDRALDLADPDVDTDAPSAFRWTVETTAPLLHWLSTATDDRIERFCALEASGRIEVTGMFSNLTPLYDQAELTESLRPLRWLREEYGLTVRHAMNGDVNGHNWPLVDRLLDAGIEGFSMAPNRHWGRAPISRPAVFHWEGPSGRTLPTYVGFQYGGGYNLGIGRDAEALRERWWPRVEQVLDDTDYELPALMVQTTHPFFDNNPPMESLPSFVQEWNDQTAVEDEDLPTLRLATPSDWWAVVEDHADDLPTYAGDWTDFWNFGPLSSAHETAMNRESRRRLKTADAFEAALTAVDAGRDDRGPARRPPTKQRGEAWWNLLLYYEHTWGADVSVDRPEDEDSRSQWHHKAKTAYEARSRSLLTRRDAVAELSRRVAPEVDE